MLGVYDYTVILTYISALSGMTGVMLCLTGRCSPSLCCCFLVGSGLCDAFDGKVARLKKNRTDFERRFGIQIDSLSDLIAFGVLPATICVSLCDGRIQKIEASVIAAFYVLAALIRLAYFNVTEEDRWQSEGGVRKFYEGLPVTTSSIIFTLIVIISHFSTRDFTYIYIVAMLLTGLAFVSKMKIPKPGHAGMLDIMYETVFGRALLRIMIAPSVSKAAGKFLDSKASKVLISTFVRKTRIDIDEYEDCEYNSFNEFFCRKIKPELRPVDMTENHFVSPCDAYLSVARVQDGLVLPIKQSEYTVESLLQNEKLAKEYEGGICLVFRLCVNHYHRYCFLDEGRIIDSQKISGVFHTVRPIALRNRPVFTENSREYAVIDTKNFGRIVQMEVGAMLVGKITNHQVAECKRGEEKGYFEYGGSTIVVLVKKDQISLLDEFADSMNTGEEISVKMGQYLGNI